MKSLALSLYSSAVLLMATCQPQPPGTSAPASAHLPDAQLAASKMNGLTFVAPPEPFLQNPMPAVQSVGASWIAVVPYAFTRAGTPSVRYHEDGWQWWGERPAGVRESIRLAHEAGISVMVKPQVYIPRSWTGTLQFAEEKDWAAWEADYERYILRFAALADSAGADLFCVGTEFNAAIQQRPQFWAALIGKVRGVYRGRLTYSANWDDWERVPFWKQLDYIGLGGYFPLIDGPTPPVDSLRQAWAPIRDRLRAFSQSQGRPILFTEFGYLSVNGAGWRNWELEQGIEQRPINQQAQANCYEALFSVFH
ncbi:MAG TPA: hypothetical protein PK858_04845, partial [Saprospiraceae bacterium]|nr:hypothetical protein [Saprospiraceae bacterium]